MRERAAARWAALRLVALAAWCGLTWSIGYAVAPAVFAMSVDRGLAGDIAGRLFAIQAYVTLVVAPLLWIGFFDDAHADERFKRDAWLVLVMLLLTLIGYFALQPLMAELRATMHASAPTSAMRTRFAWLHAVSAAFYLVHSVLGIWLVARQASRSVPRS